MRRKSEPKTGYLESSAQFLSRHQPSYTLISTVLDGFEDLLKTEKMLQLPEPSIPDCWKVAFLHLEDVTGAFNVFATGMFWVTRTSGNNLDVGDLLKFVEPFLTKRQRNHPSGNHLAGKTLMPLPDKWSGLKDKEAIVVAI